MEDCATKFAGLTERQRNELEFYEKYSQMAAPPEVNFDPVTGVEKRPWNSYWHFIELVQRHFHSDGQRLLDFGCGTGFYSLIFAKIGYEVFGFDIAPNNIAIANGYAEKYGLADKCHFRVSVAETLDYPDEYFDVVTGINILHHVDIEVSLSECMRVLRPGGIAMFHEPVRAPIFDTLRESPLGLAVVSKEASFDRHITPDERKLSNEDFELIKKFGSETSFERFLLFSRLDRFISRRDGPSLLEQLDHKLFRLLPFVRQFGGECVITIRK
jgi:2-polyprenyl-3-methyl-5-hydroxy-6-metoxy-1,4-benzoquinol methylase